MRQIIGYQKNPHHVQAEGDIMNLKIERELICEDDLNYEEISFYTENGLLFRRLMRGFDSGFIYDTIYFLNIGECRSEGAVVFDGDLNVLGYYESCFSDFGLLISQSVLDASRAELHKEVFFYTDVFCYRIEYFLNGAYVGYSNVISEYKGDIVPSDFYDVENKISQLPILPSLISYENLKKS